MFELELSRCPICQTSRQLVRQIREVQGQHFAWYECPECASVLMWLGGDRWVYQTVGRTDRQYLLKRPLTTVELQALSVAATPAPAAPTYSSPQPDLPYAPSELEEIAPIPAPVPPPAAERPKGIPRWLVIAVVIIALLFLVAATIIIATQL
jgi:hypothetical protein